MKINRLLFSLIVLGMAYGGLVTQAQASKLSDLADKADSEMKSHQFEKAKADYLALLKQAPSDNSAILGWTYCDLGVAEAGLGNNKEALADFNKAKDYLSKAHNISDQKLAKLYIAMGDIELVLQHSTEARQDLTKALEIYEHKPSENQSKIKLLKAGLSHLTAYKVSNKSASGIYSLQQGLTALEQSHYEIAKNLFKQTLLYSKDSPKIYITALALLGVSESGLGEFTQAETDLEKVQKNKTQLKPEVLKQITFDLGYDYFYLGKFDLAKNLLSHSLSPDGYKNAEISKILSQIASMPHDDNYYAIQTHPLPRWNDQTHNIVVYINPSQTVEGWKPKNDEILKKSFLVWQNALSNRFTFSYTTDPSLADVHIVWKNLIDQDEMHKQMNNSEELLLGYTQKVALAGYFCLADIIFATHDPYGNTLTDLQVSQVTEHEIGHMLGITTHSPDPRDLMYPAGTSASQPSARDIKTLNVIYSHPAEAASPEGITLSQFQKFLTLVKQSVDYNKAKKYQDAYRIDQEAWTLYPHDSGMLALYAEDAVQVGHAYEAIPLYIQLSQQSPELRSHALSSICSIMTNYSHYPENLSTPLYQNTLTFLKQASQDSQVSSGDQQAILTTLRQINKP